MLILALSAGFVGCVHSLAPGHWLPVVLMAKARRWPFRTAVLGAVVAASGHILLSILLGVSAVSLGLHYLPQYEEQIEKYSGLVLVCFGLIYALFSYFRHSGCHGHTHHGPNPEGRKAPFLFLFSVGLSPCVAVLPVFAAAGTHGHLALVLSLGAFALGVLASFLTSTLLMSKGIVKLDHPLFEHYGDVITGLGVVVMGLILFLF